MTFVPTIPPQVTAYCEWLSPLHIAVLPVRVYRPLTVRVCEHCGGERTFLQVELVNTCPLPLALKDTGLNSSLALSALHTDPEVRQLSVGVVVCGSPCLMTGSLV